MNPSSFELSLKPSKIYSPGFWTNLVNKFSKIHDLNERLTFIRNLKLELEQEAAWLVTSQPVSFPVSMAFVNNTIKSLVEEEQVIIEGMKNYQTLTRFTSSSEKAAGILTPLECGQNEGNVNGNHLSGRRLDKIPMALNQHQERWVTVNPNKRKRASDALTNRADNFSSWIVQVRAKINK
nr:hypothetical protein [Tanacetum cinerariifolium]